MADTLIPGRMYELTVNKISDQGAMVDAHEHGELFVPRRQLPQYLQEGDSLRVFLYVDGGRVLATARHPYLELGMTGRLRVTSIDCGTVYLDLGIPKELVVPVSEQRGSFEVGRMALVYVALDDQGRLFGTQRFNRYIKDFADSGEYKPGQRVCLVPVSHTPLGFRTIVDDHVYGLIYKNEQKGEIQIGKRYSGWIINVREDGRIDVSLQEPGRSGVEHAAADILQALLNSGGELDFNDKSDPEEIEDYLHISKGKFKKAIGHLYKERLIEITDEGIKLTEKGINAGKKEDEFLEKEDIGEEARQKEAPDVYIARQAKSVGYDIDPNVKYDPYKKYRK